MPDQGDRSDTRHLEYREGPLGFGPLGEVDALRETVKSLVVAAGRMLDGWAEGDDAVNERRILCGDRVVTPDGWTGRVVAQHGPFSWVAMEATNSPQTWGTSTLKPVGNGDD